MLGPRAAGQPEGLMPRPFAVTVALLVLAAAPAARAATYVVDPGGDDGHSGLAGAPWLTLQHAAISVGPGDTVIVHAGSYAGFNFNSDDGAVSGTSIAPITFSADPGVTIDQDNGTTPDGINIENVDWIVVEGFTVTGRTRSGIRAAVCNHVTVRDNVLDSNGTWGFFSGFCDDLVIEGNETSRSGTQHGIYVSNSAKRYTIRHNRSWGNAGCGIHMNGDISEGGDGINADALIDGNVIWNNGTSGGSGINGDGVQSSVIQNNLLYGNHASGISLYQIDAGDASKNNVLVNNTVVQASDGRWCLNISDDPSLAGGATGNTVLNNIFYNLHAFRGSITITPASLPGFVSDYNVVMDRLSPDGDTTTLTLAAWRTATGQDAHSLIATPAQLIENAGADDYHLAAGSPAIDVGTATHAPAVDLEDHARPAGGGFDIGAYEYGSVLVDGGLPPQTDAAVAQTDAAGTQSDAAGTPSDAAGTQSDGAVAPGDGAIVTGDGGHAPGDAGHAPGDGGAVDGTPGDGAPPDGHGGGVNGGCGCRAAGAPGTGWAAVGLLLLGAAGSGRARRRRPPGRARRPS
jgi:MYXO-CTERM domain-containing protein